METFIIYPESKEQSAVIEAFLKALKISFEKHERGGYNSEFVEQVLAGEKAQKTGKKGLRVDTDDPWK